MNSDDIVDFSGASNVEKCVGTNQSSSTCTDNNSVTETTEKEETYSSDNSTTQSPETVSIPKDVSNNKKRNVNHDITENKLIVEAESEKQITDGESKNENTQNTIASTNSGSSSNTDLHEKKDGSSSKLTDIPTAISNEGKIATTKTLPPRGILKNASSLPVLTVSENIRESHPKFFQHALSSGFLETRRNGNKHLLFQKRNFVSITSEPSISDSVKKSTQEFVNPAFELDENLSPSSKLADIVEQVLTTQPDHHRYVHPFGMRNLYASVFLGNQSKIQDSGRLIFWFVFAIVLVGLAGAIILMSEMYKYENSKANTTIER